MNNELMHYGVKGMRWGVRRYQNKEGTLNSAGRKRYQSTSSDSAVTKKVKKDLGSLSGSDFKKKYGTSTKTYMKRVDRYGDPYMNAPRAKIGKFLNKHAKNNANRYQRLQNQRLQKKADELMSKYGDKYKVEAKDNKLMVTEVLPSGDKERWVVY